MAIRPVFVVNDNPPFFIKTDIEFKYYNGMAISQQQKSIKSLHSAFLEKQSDRNILEISTKSTEKTGVYLSAFNLMMHTTINRKFTVETAYQASKVFEKGGPFIDLLDKNSIEAKKDSRLKESGNVIGFSLFGNDFPTKPVSFFYNWLYIQALSLDMNKKLANEIIKYDAYTDISFNPQKSISCQAEAAAIFTSLHRHGLLGEVLKDKEIFLKTIYPDNNRDDSYKQLSFVHDKEDKFD